MINKKMGELHKLNLTIDDILLLVKKYPNDQDLGSEIRKLVNNKK